MGCVNSTCMMPPKNEVEIDINSADGVSNIVLLRPEPKKDNPSIYIKDYVDQIPDLAKLNQVRNGSPLSARRTRVLLIPILFNKFTRKMTSRVPQKINPIFLLN